MEVIILLHVILQNNGCDFVTKQKKSTQLKNDQKEIRFSFSDIIAMSIAVIQIVLPYILIFVLGLALFIWLATTFWFK